MPISGANPAVQASELEGSADIANGANVGIQPVVGAVGLITYGHEDGPDVSTLRYDDGVTVELLAVNNAANYSIPGAMAICNTRFVRCYNNVAGNRFVSYVAVIFS